MKRRRRRVGKIGQTMQGMFTLRTAADLMEKLRHDYRRLHNAPGDPYAAFDFFVTAEHLPEWMDPPRTNLRKSALLKVVSHIANGAKHFAPDPDRHHSVTTSGRRGGYFPTGYFAPGYFAKGYFAQETLYVTLDAEAAVSLGGPQISAVSLADKVLQYWSANVPR